MLGFPGFLCFSLGKGLISCCSLGDATAGLPFKTEQKADFFSHVIVL